MNTPKTMKHSTTTNTDVDVQPGAHLLDTIKATRASYGDSLNDQELTSLLWENRLPTEAGFGFLNLSDGFVTLSVPQQDLADWYPDKGWIAADKEHIARVIADKHQLTLSEPPDEPPSSYFPSSNPPDIRHHIELSSRWETVVLAHPHYLKVRLFADPCDCLCARSVRHPLQLSPELLQDLAALYQPASRCSTPNANGITRNERNERVSLIAVS